MGELKAIRIAYGEALAELGEEMEELVVLDADLAHATMTCTFAEKYPERFFNMGIAEANMMGTAAGLAGVGYVPFASTFALFGAGRAYEQVRNSICYPGLNVKIALSHSGITVGEDGGSHQAIEDIALMRVIPNMTVIVPSDAVEAKQAVRAAAKHYGPVYLRLARLPIPIFNNPKMPFEIGKAKVLKEGKDAVIIAMGIMVSEALEAATILEKEGIDTAVINMHTIKPIDADTIRCYAQGCQNVLTVEEHSIIGGLGDAVLDVLSGKKLNFKKMGIQDRFGQSGKPADLLKEYGLTANDIADEVKKMME